MYRLDLNFADAYNYASNQEVESDCESDTHSSESGDSPLWGRLSCRLLQRIVSFLPRQSDRRNFCMVSKDWALAAEPSLWAYPEFSTPQQLSSFLHVVSENPNAHGRYIRGIRFTLTSHYDRHLVSPFYNNCDEYTDAELPMLRELVQGKHVLSADPALMRPLLHGSDLTSPLLAFRFARMCSPIDSLSVYGYRLRDKHIVNDIMRWNLRELEIIGMPRKPLANLGFMLHSMRSLRSLRIESDQPLPADIWSPLSLRMPALQKLRIWAPNIAGSQLLRVVAQQAPRNMAVLHLVGPGNDAGDELVERVVQGSPGLQSLVVHSATITARSASAALGTCGQLTYLELMRYSPEETACAVPADETVLVVVSSQLSTLTLRNLAVQDSLVCSAASVATKLRTLHIAGSSCLSGTSMASLLRASTCLVALGLYSCPLLSEHALQGLAESPSASLVRIIVVENCGVQSSGVERVLSAFPRVEHFAVQGSETLRQEFAFAFNAGDDTAVLASTKENPEMADRQVTDTSELEAVEVLPKPLPVKRSFNLVYPPDHFLSKQSYPQENLAAQEDIQENNEAGAASAPPPAASAADSFAPRQTWNDATSKKFVPGLLAFAGANVGSARQDCDTASAGRRRAATLFAEDHSAPDTRMQPVVGRMRSISDPPSGTDTMAPCLDTESAPNTPSGLVKPDSDSAAAENIISLVDEDVNATAAAVEARSIDNDASSAPLVADDNETVFRALPVEDNANTAEIEAGKGGFAYAAAATAATITMGTAAYILGKDSSADVPLASAEPDASSDIADVDRSSIDNPDASIANDIAAAMSEDISTPDVNDSTRGLQIEAGSQADGSLASGTAEEVSAVIDSVTLASPDNLSTDEAVGQSVGPVVMPDDTPADNLPVDEPRTELVSIPSNEQITDFQSADECVATESPNTDEPTSFGDVEMPVARSLAVDQPSAPLALATDESALERPAAKDTIDASVVVDDTPPALDSAIDEDAVAQSPAEETKADVLDAAVAEPDVEEAPNADAPAKAVVDEEGSVEPAPEVEPVVAGPPDEQLDADSAIVNPQTDNLSLDANGSASDEPSVEESTEEDKPVATDADATKEDVAEPSVAVEEKRGLAAAVTDEPSVEAEASLDADVKEPADVDSTSVQPLVADEPATEVPDKVESAVEDEDSTPVSRSVKVPASNDALAKDSASEPIAAVSEHTEDVSTETDVAEPVAAVEEPTSEPDPSTEAPTDVAENPVEEPVAAADTVERSLEQPLETPVVESFAEPDAVVEEATVISESASVAEPVASTEPTVAADAVVDQQSVSAPTATESSEQPMAERVFDPVSSVDESSVNPASEPISDTAEPDAEPLSVDNEAVAAVTTTDTPTELEPALDETPAPVTAEETAAEPATISQEDTAESGLEQAELDV
ncbi:hypothetical protein H4217_007437, partial [Coemansia sp. RSA 1939]